MWGTDGVRVFTVDDGWGWIFTAVEHWNAECAGWHVCKRGDRFAALQPISMGLAGLYGSTAAGAARGLALRMDHGSRYLSDHFTNQIKFWGIQPSYAFVAEPQANGVAERFNRTLKEQIIHGRIYRNIAELRDAVRDFVELYNAQWSVEERLPEPRSSSSGVARRDLNQARRVRQTCVQGTGCATGGEVVHDDDVARGQGRDQGLLDPGKEACAVDRAIENAGRGDPVVTQGGNERGCLPVAMGNGRHHPFAARCPAITPGHVRPRPGLVEKDQPFGNQPRLLVAPSGSRRRDVRALLLGGVGCLFLRLSP